MREGLIDLHQLNKRRLIEGIKNEKGCEYLVRCVENRERNKELDKIFENIGQDKSKSANKTSNK